MFTAARTEPIPSHITQEQIFNLLKIRARNSVGFLPGVKSCEVTEGPDGTGGNVFTRKLEFTTGQVLADKVTIFPPSLVRIRGKEIIKIDLINHLIPDKVRAPERDLCY